MQHAVWSTFEDTRRWVPIEDNRLPTLMGSYKVPHFDAKGEADHVFRDLHVPTTFVLTSFYWDNLIMFGMGPKPGPDGTLAMAFPMGEKKLPGIAAEDIGGCVHGIFRSSASYIGKTVGLAGEHLTGAEMASALARALGRTVRYHAVTPEQYRAFGFAGADDLANMFQFKRDFQDVFCAARDAAAAKALNPDLQTFDAWLGRHASRIPLS